MADNGAAPTTITAGERRIELQIEGLRSVVDGRFLALGQAQLELTRELESNTLASRNLTSATDLLRDAVAELVSAVVELTRKLSAV